MRDPLRQTHQLVGYQGRRVEDLLDRFDFDVGCWWVVVQPYDNAHEPLAKLLGILASPWTLLLLHRLHIEGPKRFGELKRRLGGIRPSLFRSPP